MTTMTLLKQHLKKTKASLPEALSPMDIPEILGLIFSFLSQYTLRRCVALVCHQWRAIAQPLVHGTVIWSLDKNSSFYPRKQALEGLQQAGVLRIVDDPPMKGWYTHSPIKLLADNWSVLIERLDTVAKTQRGLWIHDLRLTYHLDFDTALYPLLTLVGPKLTCLELHNMRDTKTPVETVLDLCPRLRRLHLHYNHHYTTYTWSKEQRQEWQARQRQTLSTRSSRRRLYSLTLDGDAIEKTVLLCLLQDLPELQELQLIGLRHLSKQYSDLPAHSPPKNDILVSFYNSDVFGQIAALCPRLTSIKFATVDHQWNQCIALEQWENVLAPFPMVSHYGFEARDLTTLNFRCIQTYARNTLTSLAISETWLRDRVGEPLHKYLCQSPHLLHLRAPSVNMSDAWFNPEVFRDNIVDGDQPMVRKFWACRNLQTLHLKFDWERTKRHVYSCPGNRLLIFGYIVRVCPRLRDLRISCEHIDLYLASGFCLLSRLQDLQRLTIVTRYVRDLRLMDIEWIINTPKTSVQGMKGLWAMRQVRKYESAPERRHAKHPQQDYIFDGVDFIHAGTVRDVEDALRECYRHSSPKNPWICWQNLEYFEVSSIPKEPVTTERKPFQQSPTAKNRFPFAGTARANIAATPDHPDGTVKDNWASKHEDETVLQQHVQFFDKDQDGIIWPLDTYLSFHALGFNFFLSLFATFVIHCGLSYPTCPSWVPDPFFRIWVCRIHKDKHGSDSGTYDTEGRFVPQHFEDIFSKYAPEGQDGLKWSDIFQLLKGQRVIMDPIGWFSALLEWSFTYLLLWPEDGVMHKNDIRRVYDGSIFYELAEKQRLNNAAAAKKDH
ncbi:hypothetical protein BG011_009940 [Mortierella polycephala]|uniref:F-box domain-containing protein n=1 Tax=Mortierella polycephala TaxID=41804 RepID=A0A9P6QCJ0_9FUNG|nr:hypothetical protein BG011_009940 [Mortierella polycephala]